MNKSISKVFWLKTKTTVQVSQQTLTEKTWYFEREEFESTRNLTQSIAVITQSNKNRVRY